MSGVWENTEHRLCSDMAGPFVLVGGPVIGIALAALPLRAAEVVMGGQRGADHHGILSVQFDDQINVRCVEAHQEEHFFSLRSGGDTLGG